MDGARNFFARSDFRFNPFNNVQSAGLAIIEVVGIISCVCLIYKLISSGLRSIDPVIVAASIAMLSIAFVILVYAGLLFMKGKAFMREAAKNLIDSEDVRKMASHAEAEMALNQRSFELQMQSQRGGNVSSDSFSATGMREKVNSLDRDYSGGAHVEWETTDMNKGQAIALVEKYVNMYAMGEAIPIDVFANWSKAANMPNKELRLFCKDMNECTKGNRKLHTMQDRLAKIRKKWDEKGE